MRRCERRRRRRAFLRAERNRGEDRDRRANAAGIPFSVLMEMKRAVEERKKQLQNDPYAMHALAYLRAAYPIWQKWRDATFTPNDGQPIPVEGVASVTASRRP